MADRIAHDDDLSLFSVGTTLIQRRWSIVRWAVVGALLAFLMVLPRQPVYRAWASFVPEGADNSRSGLANLAGQLGVNLPAGTAAVSPEFYSALLRSRVLLAHIARDTFEVREEGGRHATFAQLFKIESADPAVREEQSVRLLAAKVGTTVSKTTGVVDVTITTLWPSVSLAIVRDLIRGVNDYNQRTRQGQAAAERAFVEGRLKAATDDLATAEDKLKNFLSGNRQLLSGQLAAPTLSFERERLQREMVLRQQVFTSLTQAYEDARIREVRDTPVITLVEPPTVAATPEPRGRVKGVLVGLVVGGFIGAFLALVSRFVQDSRRNGNPDMDEFYRALNGVRVIGRLTRHENIGV